HHRQAITPGRRIGDGYARQQAALRLGQLRVLTDQAFAVDGAVTAGGDQQAQTEQGQQLQRIHRTPPSSTRSTRCTRSKPESAIQLAISASRVTISDSTRPSGITAQASRACCRALMKPSSQAASRSRK